MNMLRPPRILMIPPWIRARFNRDEPVSPFSIGYHPPTSGKIWVDRRAVLVRFMQVPPGGVRLPHFYQRFAHRPAFFVQHAPAHDDPFTQGLSAVLRRQVAIACGDQGVPENRPSRFCFCMWQQDQRFRRRALRRRNISRMGIFRLGARRKFSIGTRITHLKRSRRSEICSLPLHFSNSAYTQIGGNRAISNFHLLPHLPYTPGAEFVRGWNLLFVLKSAV